MRKDKIKKNRRTYKPSEELLSFLESDRLVPATIPLPDIGTMHRLWIKEEEENAWKFYEEMKSQGKYVNEDILLKEARNRADILGWNFVLYVTRIAEAQPLINRINFKFSEERGFDVSHKINAYRVFLETRRTLFRIVHLTNDPDNIGSKRSFEFIEDDVPIVVSVYFNLSKDREFNFLNNHVVEALQGVPADRLRFCPVCMHVFWVYRLDQKRCSKKCTDVHFQKQRRANPKKRDEINENRRRNYAHKAASKRNGEK